LAERLIVPQPGRLTAFRFIFCPKSKNFTGLKPQSLTVIENARISWENLKPKIQAAIFFDSLTVIGLPTGNATPREAFQNSDRIIHPFSCVSNS
jgi:hypothetical protein